MYVTNQELVAFSLGFSAYERTKKHYGEGLEDNPYAQITPEWYAWKEGYIEAYYEAYYYEGYEDNE